MGSPLGPPATVVSVLAGAAVVPVLAGPAVVAVVAGGAAVVVVSPPHAAANAASRRIRTTARDATRLVFVRMLMPLPPVLQCLLYVDGHRLQVGHIVQRVAAAQPPMAAFRAPAAAERLVGLPVVGAVVEH